MHARLFLAIILTAIGLAGSLGAQTVDARRPSGRAWVVRPGYAALSRPRITELAASAAVPAGIRLPWSPARFPIGSTREAGIVLGRRRAGVRVWF
jgi:hypothetical protein